MCSYNKIFFTDSHKEEYLDFWYYKYIVIKPIKFNKNFLTLTNIFTFLFL